MDIQVARVFVALMVALGLERRGALAFFEASRQHNVPFLRSFAERFLRERFRRQDIAVSQWGRGLRLDGLSMVEIEEEEGVWCGID